MLMLTTAVEIMLYIKKFKMSKNFQKASCCWNNLAISLTTEKAVKVIGTKIFYENHYNQEQWQKIIIRNADSSIFETSSSRRNLPKRGVKTAEEEAN